MGYETSARTLALLSPEMLAVDRLQHMLTFCRPAGSESERKFIREFITPLKPQVDAIGNRHIVVPMPDGSASSVLWSSHTDTVHRASGRQAVQRVGDVLKLTVSEKSSCLGADCTTGVWLMLEMIRAGVPGHYVFHRGEECGGIGSMWLAKNQRELLEQFKYAIAFDRRGNTDIITHQGGVRCASDVFAASMAEQLPTGYRADDGGSFTDTANYTDIIGECSNISVGYSSEHSTREQQSIADALELRACMLAFNERTLVAERKPGEYEALYSYSRYSGRYTSDWRDYRDEWQDNSESGVWRRSDYAPAKPRTMMEFVETYPDLVVDILEQFGLDIVDMNKTLEEYYGRTQH